jgi:hypothetical protein
MDELSLPEDPAARTQQIMAGAAKQCDQLSSGAPTVVQDFARRVVQRVVVHPDRIEVEVGKQKLRAALTADPRTSSARACGSSKRPDLVRAFPRGVCQPIDS